MALHGRTVFRHKSKFRSFILLTVSSILLLILLHISGLRICFVEVEKLETKTVWKPAWPSRKAKIPCASLMNSLAPPYPILVLDENFVKKLEKGEICLKKDFPPYFAHPREYFPKTQNLAGLVTYENRTDYNFYRISDQNGKMRAIFKNQYTLLKNWSLPENGTIFHEQWKRSTLLGCKDMYMFRNPFRSRHVWSEEQALEAMDDLVQHFLQYDMYIFICSGTLLGWYRECGFIPHTHDVDFGVLEEEYLEDAFTEIINNNTRFRPYIRWSDEGNTMEYTLYPSQTSNRPKIDVFLYFSNGKNTSTYSFGWDEKFRFTYPKLYNPYCAVDFRGHLFWTTCNPEMAVIADYGAKWYRDYHTADYNYVYSTWNMEELGEYNTSAGKHYFEEFDTVWTRCSPSISLFLPIALLLFLSGP